MNFVQLFGVLISSAVIENLLFARAIGADHIINRSRSYFFILYFSFVVAMVSCLSAIPLWWLGNAFGKAAWWPYARNIAALLLVVLAHFGVSIGGAMCGFYRRLRLIDQGAAYSAALAIVLLAMSSKLPFFACLLYCVGSAAGLGGAMVLVHSGRDRLAFCNLPRSFAGLPITMIYIGIISLAIYGLIGHQLPT